MLLLFGWKSAYLAYLDICKYKAKFQAIKPFQLSRPKQIPMQTV